MALRGTCWPSAELCYSCVVILWSFMMFKIHSNCGMIYIYIHNTAAGKHTPLWTLTQYIAHKIYISLFYTTYILIVFIYARRVGVMKIHLAKLQIYSTTLFTAFQRKNGSFGVTFFSVAMKWLIWIPEMNMYISHVLAIKQCISPATLPVHVPHKQGIQTWLNTVPAAIMCEHYYKHLHVFLNVYLVKIDYE